MSSRNIGSAWCSESEYDRLTGSTRGGPTAPGLGVILILLLVEEACVGGRGPIFLWIYQSYDLFFYVRQINGFRLCATRDWSAGGPTAKNVRIPFPSHTVFVFFGVVCSTRGKVPLVPRRQSASAIDLNNLSYLRDVSDCRLSCHPRGRSGWDGIMIR